ncbi:hypothetical protein ILYODFUR_028742, partial [Ilyodon furcidens]
MPEQIQPWTQRPETPGHITPQVEARHSPGVQDPASSHRECQYPIGTTSLRTQEVVPFPPGVETGRPPHHLNLVQASPGSCLNLSDSGPDFDLIMENETSRASSSVRGSLCKDMKK